MYAKRHNIMNPFPSFLTLQNAWLSKKAQSSYAIISKHQMQS